MNASGLFSGPSPRWFTIPAQRPFLGDLASGLLAALSPEGLAGAVVLLPTRRGARALAEAFLGETGGGALLLPQIRALGDLDEGEPPFEPGDLALDLPAAIDPFRRRFELAALVAENAGPLGRSIDATGALELADALCAFLDSVEIEEVAEEGRAERIAGIVDTDLAEHWRISADFLAVALAAWPARLAELGLIDPAARRVKLLRRLAEQWTHRPPAEPMIAAGSTGTAPANADLLAVIAGLPQGAVVLPGLDLELADEAWAEVGEQHPQGAMKRLIGRAGVCRDQLRLWPSSADTIHGRWRRRIINEALRPPEATADWIQQIKSLQAEGAREGVDPMAEGLKGLTVLSARSEEQAAAAAALLLRETLETPGRTAALVTPDQALARRVSARLARWGVEVDSSAGTPLAASPVGVLLALAAGAVVDPADPVVLLAILKHPLVRLGMEPDQLARSRRALERRGLRGPRGPGADWIERHLVRLAEPRSDQAEASPELLADLADAARLLGLFRGATGMAAEPYTGGTATPAEAARGLVLAVEVLAADPDGDLGGVWAGPEGEAAVGLLAALVHQSSGLPEVLPRDFQRLLIRLLDGEIVRAVRAAHPRLKILGAIESRLVSADRLILAGLEEGVWPLAAPTDPFLSRPMRKAFGLPPPERRIGLSAHDFAQAACAPEVVLIHSERRGGAPAVESRWLWRLRTLARGAKAADGRAMALPGRPELLTWAAAIDEPGPFAPAPRPRPAPPVDTRPTTLPVTRVETWVRDPYAIYARYVLRLRPLERPNEPVEARIRGVAVHRALQRFAELYPDELPDNAAPQFQALLLDALVEAGMDGGAMAREHALAARAAPWVMDFERRRRQGAHLLVEQQGALQIAGGFTVTARADRLEVRTGGVDVLDFKTGGPPSKKQVESGFAPQLTLTAAILHGGGFAEVGKAAPGELLYVQITGRRNQPEPRLVASGVQSLELAAAALDGLTRRVERFRSPAVGYVSWAAPQFMFERGGDYDHLARVWEWHVIGDGEEGGE